MDLKLLGPLEIVPQIRGVELRRAKEHSILAVLALAPGQVVTTETLITRVWDDDAPSDTAKRTMRTYVRNVRGAVAAAGGARVESLRGGYALRIDRENVDVHRFHRLVTQAEAIAASGDAERAVSLLREADGLWRDQALAGLHGSWIASVRHGLHEERRLATDRRVGLELGLGRHAELIGELAQLSEQYPLDETWVAYQMQALYRTGREVDALGLYHQDYQRRTELGLDASPGLAALQGRILRHDPSLVPKSADRRAIRHAPRNSGLPPRPGLFVGRDQEIAVLCDVADTDMPSVRIVHGMGGCGKSTLAVEAAYRLHDSYPDPPAFLPFHAHEAGQTPLGARDALRQLLEMAGIIPEPVPQTITELAALWQRELASRRSVIVLDDVPDAAAIADVLPAAGESIVIVTSRHRLPEIPGSAALALAELALDDAITLFTRTAGESRIDDPAILPRAVRLCGCLPLALTMSASRLRDQGTAVSEFVSQIEERRAFPDRIGMAATGFMQTFELSYAGLDAGHREFFRRLGINPCHHFSARTAAVLVGVEIEEAEAAISVLHGRHLVEESISGRYRFHDLIREYATFVSERDDPSWERRSAERRLLEYYLISARRADEMLYPFRRHAARNPGEYSRARHEINSVIAAGMWFELEWRNIVGLATYAARHEWQEYCVGLADAVAGFLEGRGYLSDGIDLHRTAFRVCQGIGDPACVAREAGELSLLELRTGSYQDALAHASEAAEIFRSTGDENGAAEAIDRIGAIHRHMGRARVALAYHQEALEAYRKVPNVHGMAEALGRAGTAYYSLGRYAEAIAHHENALALYRETGDQRGAAKSYNNIGDALARRGRYRDAMVNLKQSLQLLQEVNAIHDLAPVRLNMGYVAQSKGQYHEAIAEYRLALEACRKIGDLRHLAAALYEIGAAYQHQEYYDQALIHHQEAEAIAMDLGDLGMQVIANLGIADALRGGGSYSGALDRYGRALELAL
jgi:tetratricopeptide (TPR) repeat protein/DNA-binding SARP family transcriptional activator